MPDHYDQLRDDYVTGEPLPASEYNSLVRIIDTQVEGALEGVGSGVISGGAVTAGSGLSVDVSALKAVADTQHGYCYLESTAATVGSLPDNSTVYIWARAVFPVNPGDPDSRETAYVDFYWALSDTGEADAVLLAEVTTASGAVSSITDRRTYIPAQQALALAQSFSDDISDLQAAVGEEYFGDNPPASSLHDRVTALESGGGGGGSGTVYWGGLEKAVGDSTTIDQAIEQAKQDVLDQVEQSASAGGTSVTVEVFDVDSVNQARAVLKLTRTVDPDLPSALRDCAVIVWGAYGDGSGGTPVLYDQDHTTWLPSQS